MAGLVETVTNKLSALTTSEPAAPNSDAITASAAEGRRLYIGNLAYATTEEQLKAFFTGYNVESTSIPTNPRTNRPVGYAFVDLATTAEAERAINDLSGKDILERKVSVQLARKPEPAGAKEGAVSGGEASGSGEEGARRRGSGRGRGRGRGGRTVRGGRTTRGPREAGEEAGAAAAAEVPAATTPAAATTTTGEEAKSPTVPKERRQRGPPEDGIPSKIKVMVANLPYDLSEDKLKELFAAYQPTAAKIALRPIPRFMVRKLQARNEPRKGRGFGFVTLPSEDLQQKAVNEMNGKEVEGREIAVKVAIDSPGREEEAANEDAAVENGVHPEPIAA